MQTFLNKVQTFALENNLFSFGDKVLLGISGGIDSCVMLEVFSSLKKKFNLTIAIAHVNYNLRKESIEEEKFVCKLSKNYNVPFYLKNIFLDKKNSIQENARTIRYNFFVEVATLNSYNKIAVAHNLNDNLETVFFNFIRGSFLGFSGIPIKREIEKNIFLIRPILKLKRNEIEKFANEKKMEFKVDSSNFKNDYSRNFLRNEVIPKIENKLNPNFSETNYSNSKVFLDLYNFVEIKTKEIIPKIILKQTKDELIFSLSELNKVDIFLAKNFVHLFVSLLAKSSIDSDMIEKFFLFLSSAENGKKFNFSKSIYATKSRNEISVAKAKLKENFLYKIELNKKYKFKNFEFESNILDLSKFKILNNSNVEFADLEKLNSQLFLRNWKCYDNFYPIGGNYNKKISDFFIDKKIPIKEKTEIPLLICDEKIVWVCGKRLDNRFKVDSNTKKIIKLKFKKIEKEN